MSIFARTFGYFGSLRTKLKTDTSDGLYPGGPSGRNIIPMDETVAMSISAVWACLNVIGGTIGTLPLELFHAKKDGEIQPAKDHPLYSVLNSDPNYDLTCVDFWEYMSAAIELHGSGYAKKVKSVLGGTSSLIPINPSYMQVRRKTSGELEYTYMLEGKRYVDKQDDVLHIRGSFATPMGGVSTLSAGARTLRTAFNAEHAASQTFDNGMSPSGVLTYPRPLDKAQRKKAKNVLLNEYQGSINSGRPLILDNGVTWEALSIAPKDAQMLETRGFSVEEICRFFGVHPFMIGHSEKSTSWGKGLEQQILAFLKFTLRRRLKRIEKSLEKQLLTPEERARGMYIKFNMEALLRGDSAARAKFYEIMIRNGIFSQNYVRELEGLPAVDGGDECRVQMQNVPLNEATGNENGDPQNA